jgi:hypothetical protein
MSTGTRLYVYQCPICFEVNENVSVASHYPIRRGEKRYFCKICRAILKSGDTKKKTEPKICVTCGKEFFTWKRDVKKCKGCRIKERIELRADRQRIDNIGEVRIDKNYIPARSFSRLQSKTGCVLKRVYGGVSRCAKYETCANKNICLMEIPTNWSGFTADCAGYKITIRDHYGNPVLNGG